MSNILSIPVGDNRRLGTILDLVDGDGELQTLWRCANVLAIDRLGYNDHGPVHVKIVANAALRMLRMLVGRGVEPSVKVNYGLAADDAEVVVVLASIMHDLGMAVIREAHEAYSVQLAQRFLGRYLPALYQTEEATILAVETLHAILSHHAPSSPLTVEAGIVRIADALDMEKGRARIPFEAGKVDIHSVSALSIERVSIAEGAERPILIRIEMSNPSGIFQVDNLLAAKIRGSGLERQIQIDAVVSDASGSRLLKRYEA